jgi:hypothetical protein
MNMKSIDFSGFVFCVRFANGIEQHNRIEAATQGNRNSIIRLKAWL